MKRSQLEHLLRAASAILGERQFVLIGSQSLHGKYPDLPDEILVSMEADLIAKRNPRRTEALNVIGIDSPFHEAYGYYADPVTEDTAILPKGWRGRLVNLVTADGVTALCLGACRTYFTPARASLWDAVQGAKRAVVSLTTSALQRRNAPKARLALRVAAKKARLRRCSSLIWNDQTALLAPCRRAFLAATQARNKSDRLLEPHDLAIAKYVANRNKDRVFVHELARRGLLQQATLLRLLHDTPLTAARRAQISGMIDSDFGGSAV